MSLVKAVDEVPLSDHVIGAVVADLASQGLQHPAHIVGMSDKAVADLAEK